MSMSQQMSAESDFLLVKAQGTFALDEAKTNFIQMLEEVARHKVTKVLIDGREVTGEPELMERFYYGEFAARTLRKFSPQGVSPATHFAYVLEQPVRDRNRFGENVAVNRGMSVKTFEVLDDAREWLRSAACE